MPPSTEVRRGTAGQPAGTPPGQPPRRRFWDRRTLAVAAVGLVAGASFVVVNYGQSGQPGAKSLAAAMKALGDDGASDGSAPSSSGLHYRYPEPGVYELAGEGSEHISFPPRSQSDSRIMPGSISILKGGCWRWRVDYNVAHWEYYDFCPTAGSLLLRGNSNSETWTIGLLKISNLARFTCPAGTVWLSASSEPHVQAAYSCTGTNTAVAGRTTSTTTIRDEGVVTLTVGGERVRTVEEQEDTVLTGGQKGTVAETWWLELQSGMPVRMQRSMSIATASPLGDIDYTESGHWQMAYLAPQIR